MKLLVAIFCLRLYIWEPVFTAGHGQTLLISIKHQYQTFTASKTVIRVVRGPCKKFCHWVRITLVLRFIKHILYVYIYFYIQTFKVFPLY